SRPSSSFAALIGIGGGIKTVDWVEPNSVPIEHRGEDTAHCSLLAPDLDAMGLLVPEVAAIRWGYDASVRGGITPCCYPLNGAGFVPNPLPWNDTLLASFLQQAIDLLHFIPGHRRNQAGCE